MSYSRIRKTIKPLGHRADGTPFWALTGGDGTGAGDGGASDGDGAGSEDDGDEGDSGGEDEDDASTDDSGLTSKGRKAVAAERAAADRARKALKPFQALRRETGLTVEEMRARLMGAGGTGTKNKGNESEDDAPDAETIRREARREANDQVNAKLIKASVRVAASDLLADPSDAARYLDLSDYEVDDDGEVDARQIRRDLKALITDRPYLAKAAKKGSARGGSPDFDGGSRSTSQKTNMSDLIRAAAARRR